MSYEREKKTGSQLAQELRVERLKRVQGHLREVEDSLNTRASEHPLVWGVIHTFSGMGGVFFLEGGWRFFGASLLGVGVGLLLFGVSLQVRRVRLIKEEALYISHLDYNADTPKE